MCSLNSIESGIAKPICYFLSAILTLDMPNSRNTAKTTSCRIDNGFGFNGVILASFDNNTLPVSTLI